MASSASPAEVDVRVEGERVVGSVLALVAPGTKAAERDRLLDRVLRAPLDEAASALQAVLVAAPCSYARARPGKDAAGRTCFDVGARVEGERLVPDLPRAS